MGFPDKPQEDLTPDTLFSKYCGFVVSTGDLLSFVRGCSTKELDVLDRFHSVYLAIWRAAERLKNPHGPERLERLLPECLGPLNSANRAADEKAIMLSFLEVTLGHPKDAPFDKETLDYAWSVHGFLPEFSTTLARVEKTNGVLRTAGLHQLTPEILWSVQRAAGLENAECIQLHSEEPAHDLRYFFGGVGESKFLCSQVSIADLEGHYTEYAYIYDASCFPQSSSFRGTEKRSSEEIELRKYFARRDTKRPPLKEQEQYFRLIRGCSSHEVDLMKIFKNFWVNGQQITALIDLVTAIGAKKLPSFQVALLRHCETVVEEDIPKAVMIFQDIMQLPEELCLPFQSLFLENRFSDIAEQRAAARFKEHQESVGEESMDDLRTLFDFSKHPELEAPEKPILDAAFAGYEEILRLGERFIQMSDAELQRALGTLVPSTAEMHDVLSSRSVRFDPDRARTFDRKDVLLFLSIGRELLRRHFGIYPRGSQVLSVLLMNTEKDLLPEGNRRGIYEQIETGEGKSLIFALQAVLLAVQGRKVDVCSSDRHLAARDAMAFEKFYQSFHLHTSYYAFGGMILQPQSSIVHTTHADLSFAEMKANLNRSSIDRFDALLMDEADMNLDIIRNGCRLSDREYGVSNDVLAFFVETVDALVKEEGGADNVFMDVARLIALIKSRSNKAKFPYEIETMNELDVLRYALAAHTSQLFEENVHFVKRGGNIVIVDHRHTERLQPDMQWENGLHQCVALRNKLQPQPRSSLKACMNMPEFLSQYEWIGWISGTMGNAEDRREIQELLQVTGWDIPRHRPTKREDAPLRFIPDDKLHDSIEHTIEMHSPRPLLIQRESIKAAITLYEHLKSTGRYARLQLLTDHDNRDVTGANVTDQRDIIRAASAENTITITTDCAGRGTDIKLAQQIAAIGGLHVCGTGVADNIRVERQLRGRAGRQADPGSSEVLASSKCEFLASLSDKVRSVLYEIAGEQWDGPDIVPAVELVRRCEGIVSSLRRRMFYLTHGPLHDHLKQFLDDKQWSKTTQAPEVATMLLELWVSQHGYKTTDDILQEVRQQHFPKQMDHYLSAITQLQAAEKNATGDHQLQIIAFYRTVINLLGQTLSTFSPEKITAMIESIVQRAADPTIINRPPDKSGPDVRTLAAAIATSTIISENMGGGSTKRPMLLFA